MYKESSHLSQQSMVQRERESEDYIISFRLNFKSVCNILALIMIDSYMQIEQILINIKGKRINDNIIIMYILISNLWLSENQFQLWSFKQLLKKIDVPVHEWEAVRSQMQNGDEQTKSIDQLIIDFKNNKKIQFIEQADLTPNMRNKIKQFSNKSIKLGLQIKKCMKNDYPYPGLIYLIYDKQLCNSVKLEFITKLKIVQSSQQYYRNLFIECLQIYILTTKDEIDTFNFIIQCNQEVQICIQFSCNNFQNLWHSLKKIGETKILKSKSAIMVKIKQNLTESQSIFKISKLNILQGTTKQLIAIYNRVIPDQNESIIYNNLSLVESKLFQVKQNYYTINYQLPHDIDKITQIYRSKNILFLKNYWQAGLRQMLQSIHRRWIDYQYAFGQSIYKLIRLLYIKSYQIQQFYESQYPQSLQIIKGFMQKIGECQKKQIIKITKLDCVKEVAQINVDDQYINGVKVQNCLEDRILKCAILSGGQIINKKIVIKVEDIEKKIKQNSYYLKKLIQIAENFEQESSKWQDAINILFSQMHRNYQWPETVSYPQKKASTISYSQEIFKNAQDIQSMQLNCLGCAIFFIQNFNIYDRSVIKTSFKFFESSGSIFEEKLMKSTICSFLNNRQGGVILFDCHQFYDQTIAKGAYFTKAKMQKYFNTLLKYLESFSPKVKVQEDIIIRYVPIKINKPIEELFLKNRRSQSFKEGYFVLRITVKPNYRKPFIQLHQDEIQKLSYFYKLNCSTYYSYQSKNKMQIRQIDQNKIVLDHNNPDLFDEDERLIRQSFFLGHKCCQLQIGFTIKEQNSQFCPQEIHLSSQIQEQSSIELRFMTYIQLSNYQPTLSRVNLQKLLIQKNVKFQYVTKFNKYRMVPQKAIILIHNITFEQLSKLTLNKKNSYKLIEITKFIQLCGCPISSRMPTQFLSKLNNFIQIESLTIKSEYQSSLDHQLCLAKQSYTSSSSNYYIKSKTLMDSLIVYFFSKYIDCNDCKVRFNNLPQRDNLQIINWNRKGHSRIATMDIYKHLETYLLGLSQKVYSLFKKQIFGIKNAKNSQFQPTIFFILLNQLIQDKNLDEWGKNMREYFSSQQFQKIVISLSTQANCVAYLGIKLIRYWLLLTMNPLGLSDFIQLKKTIQTQNSMQGLLMYIYTYRFRFPINTRTSHLLRFCQQIKKTKQFQTIRKAIKLMGTDEIIKCMLKI